MFSVIFEVFPKKERFEEYLALAKHLKPLLDKIDGFVDNGRFGSKRRRGWILSHSTWRDEKSVLRWRTTGEHQKIQERGRSEIFQDYHLRVGDVIADTNAPGEAPIKEQRVDETEVGVAKVVTFTETTPEDGTILTSFTTLASTLGLDVTGEGIFDYDVVASIYNPGKLALLISWKNVKAAGGWTPVNTGFQTLRHRRIRIVHDYSMFDRREAPQFYPDAEGRETKHSATAR
jgi:heme-degrading monooxygenase HmoA